jgi:hypothetical protein
MADNIELDDDNFHLRLNDVDLYRPFDDDIRRPFDDDEIRRPFNDDDDDLPHHREPNSPRTSQVRTALKELKKRRQENILELLKKPAKIE